MDKKELLSSKLTNKEIAGILGVSVPTVCRMRKALSVPSSNKGSLKGQRPWLRTRIYKSCAVCGKETHNHKYCSRECMYKSEEYKDMLRSIDKSYMYTEEYQEKLRKDTTPAYKRYANKVHRLSQRIYEEYEHIINPDSYERTLCGVEGGYQLDHIIPVRYGFDNNIPPEELARVDNLRMIPWKQNLLKRDKLEG